MNCKQCGLSMEDGLKFCPNCGAPTEAEETQADAVNAPVADTAVNVPDPSVTPVQPTPVADPIPPQPAAAPAPNAIPNSAPQNQPYENPYANAGVPNNAIPNGVPYDPTMNPIPPMDGQKPKKKKKVWLIVLLICIPVLIILAIVGCIVGYGISIGTRGAEAVTDYWDAYVNCSGEDLAETIPDGYWDYISETYDLTEEEAIAGMDAYLQDTSDSLGGDLSYDWNQTGVQAGFGSSDTLDEAKEVLKSYGLDCTSGIGISMDATLTGATDSEDYGFALWLVKIDGDWYNVSAMTDFETVCESGYADSAKYMAEFGDTVDSFWTAFSGMDVSTLSTMVPANYWDFISNQYGYTQIEAEDYLTQYLQDGLEQSYGSAENLSILATITDVTEYSDDDLSSVNEGLEEFGLAGDALTDVYVDLSISNDADVDTTDSTYVTMTSIGGSWYVYDVMYYYADACSYYGE